MSRGGHRAEKAPRGAPDEPVTEATQAEAKQRNGNTSRREGDAQFQ